MTKTKHDLIKQKLKPFRKQIDALDVELLALLGKRFSIVRRVAKVKIDNDIPAFLGDRVEQVRENAVAQGLKYGIDPQFIRTLYTLIIYQSCALEDTLKYEDKKKKAAPRTMPKKPKRAPKGKRA